MENTEFTLGRPKIANFNSAKTFKMSNSQTLTSANISSFTVITNCWKLGRKTPCEHCGKFNHKSEDCRIANNKLQKEVKPTGLTSLKGLKVSPFNESENSKGVKVKPLIDQNCYGSLLGNRLVNLGISKQQHLYLKTKNLI